VAATAMEVEVTAVVGAVAAKPRQRQF
jgi:hypothetical protein